MSAGGNSKDAEHTNGSTTDSSKAKKVDKQKERKKKQKENKQLRRTLQNLRKTVQPVQKQDASDDIIVEYVPAPIEIPDVEEEKDNAFDDDFVGLGLGAGGLGFSFAKPEKKNPYEDFRKVFEYFTPAADADDEAEDAAAVETKVERVKEQKATTSEADEDEDVDAKESSKSKLSKKQRKMLNQLKIAELKQLCEKPEVVEVWDVTAPDPQLLVYLKAYRNSVPVPRHWSQKRKYLQGKRGIEKPPFKLPDFIEATGISGVRQAYQEKEDAKKMKQKQRERMQPKIGRMDIDYQILHDAFFKHQTKPKMTTLGDLYYEGKEYEAHVENVRPGVLGEELQKALGMSDGAPPPWLINMQRYGPPPSYPNLKIPGLNAPIPLGASFGYHPGGWGKPPVDEDGVPLYGDVFGQYQNQADSDEEVDKTRRWGEMEEEEEESEEEEAQEQEDQEEITDQDFADGIASGIMSGIASGLASGIASSLPSGIETPEMVNLRKASESVETRPLYTILEQKAVPIGQGGLMGSDHVYVIPGQDKGGKRRPDILKGIPTDVDVTLDPEEIDGLDEAQIAQLYEERIAEQRAATRREDFSDLVAAKAAQQKRKITQAKVDKAVKKQKGDTFKF